jgi:ATP-dependent Clp protease ATP-binding subunit ClpC
MPKINVYVPDELAEAIKESGIPVSAVCQRALETAVRRVTAIREAVITPSTGLSASNRLTHFTDRARDVMKLAVARARSQSAAEVGTEHLLHGLLAEGGNLALHVLSAMEIEPEQVGRELERHESAAAGRTAAAGPAPDSAAQRPASVEAGVEDGGAEDGGAGADPGPAALDEGALRFGGHAAAALELAVTEATSLGHNYVGCEHLLLGLVAEPDGAGGRILRSLGAELRLTRRAVSAAIAGYVHLRAQQGSGAPPAAEPADPMSKLSELIDRQLQPVVQRLERIERNLHFGDG